MYGYEIFRCFGPGRQNDIVNSFFCVLQNTQIESITLSGEHIFKLSVILWYLLQLTCLNS